MILSGAKRLAQGAGTALGAMVGAVRHAAWYVSYRIEGRARDHQD
jgi:hypothetical protein